MSISDEMHFKRRALATAVTRAIDLMDEIDAELVDLEEESDAEAVDEDGDTLDAGEIDGWRRPRRGRISHTERPRRAACRALTQVQS